MDIQPVQVLTRPLCSDALEPGEGVTAAGGRKASQLRAWGPVGQEGVWPQRGGHALASGDGGKGPGEGVLMETVRWGGSEQVKGSI